ncbi:hypothetical protein [Burkholderia stabilis]|uniref:hypothetical protein n=1 Tax=Burkholderia stabilis TaxID=95485 RepID=UPI0012FDDB4A|nr:hypothetical protein [Burkholderia stabilis]
MARPQQQTHRAKALTERKVTDSTAETFFGRVLPYPVSTQATDRDAIAVNERATKTAGRLYGGRGKG